MDRKHISEQIAALLSAFPNFTLRDHEIYITRLVDEIALNHPSASELEGACRRMGAKDAPPAIAEMLAALAQEKSLPGQTF